MLLGQIVETIAGAGVLGIVCTVASVVLGLGIYLLPAGIAFLRGHQSSVAIALVTVLLGWSFIGWVVALVWAFTNPRPIVVEQHFHG